MKIFHLFSLFSSRSQITYKARPQFHLPIPAPDLASQVPKSPEPSHHSTSRRLQRFPPYTKIHTTPSITLCPRCPHNHPPNGHLELVALVRLTWRCLSPAAIIVTPFPSGQLDRTLRDMIAKLPMNQWRWEAGSACFHSFDLHALAREGEETVCVQDGLVERSTEMQDEGWAEEVQLPEWDG